MAWQTWTPSAIKGYRISSGETFDISPSRGGDTARSPEVDGTRVAWYGSKGLYYAVPASEATRFPDVPTGHHYLTAIEGVAAQGIMTGYGDGNFGPNDWLIHQQFAQMIDLTMGYPVTEEDLYDFTDKPPIVHLENLLYPYHYVAVAALNGVMVAYGDGTFRPLYRERRNEAIEAAVRAGGDKLTPAHRRLRRPPHRRRRGDRRSPARGRVQRSARQHRRTRRDPGELGSRPNPPPGRRWPSFSGTCWRRSAPRHSPPLTGCRAGPPGGRPGQAGERLPRGARPPSGGAAPAA